jgi:hypothetical protein
MAAVGFYSATIIDYDNEADNIRGEVVALSAANFSAQATLRGNWHSALGNLILGVRKSERFGNDTFVSGIASADANAQRELKMLVQWHDSVTDDVVPSIELPCPDLSNLDPNDRAHFNIGDESVIDALVTALEAVAVNPLTYNALVVDELTLVGRRL